MSSIYKKGRDGYYYYQAYVYNPETGKKNKRIFHSLGTRDEIIAKQKQRHFDKKYHSATTSSKFTELKKGLKSFYIIIPLFVSLIIFINYLTKSSKVTEQVDQKIFKGINKIDIDSNINNGFKTHESKRDSVAELNIIQDSNGNQESIYENTTIKTINDFPPYKIVRSVRNSGAFNQMKIFATVEGEKVDKIALRMLCDSLKIKFKDFNYLVICLYDDSEEGLEMAMGNNFNVSGIKKKQAWLAMYTSNPVEGAIFNDNPSGYLGAY